MNIVNTVFLIVGILVLAIGILAFFNPAFTRWINAPGGPKLKAIIATVTGIIFIILAFIMEIPLE